MHKLKEKVIQKVEEKGPQYIDASDKIWGFAEIRFSLKKSADVLVELLEGENFKIDRGIARMDHAFVATYGEGKPVIGILGEYDALDSMSQKSHVFEKCNEQTCENGHGCGHHGLGIAGALSAVAIKYMMVENNISGTIKYFGCPAEESGSGKAFMARDGIFDNLDCIFTWHPMTENALYSKSSLANYQIFFNFKGKSSHAASSPDQGRSALDAAELMNVGVNYLREHIIDGARIHYAYIDVGGKSPNVVQPTSKLLYFIRAPRSSQLKSIYERIVKIAQGAALMTETELKIEWDSACAEYIVNDTLSRIVHKNIVELGNITYTHEEKEYAQKLRDTMPESSINIRFEELKEYFPNASSEEIKLMVQQPILQECCPYQLYKTPSFSSTDVGDASWQAPTAQFTLASYPNGIHPHSWQWVASGKSSIFHKSVIYASKIMGMSILDVLLDNTILEKAKSEMQKTLNGEEYPAALPKDVFPNLNC